jgi:hypothetical protein
MSLDALTDTGPDVATMLRLHAPSPGLSSDSNNYVRRPLRPLRANAAAGRCREVAADAWLLDCWSDLVLPVALDSSDDADVFTDISSYFTLVTNDDGIGLYKRIEK